MNRIDKKLEEYKKLKKRISKAEDKLKLMMREQRKAERIARLIREKNEKLLDGGKIPDYIKLPYGEVLKEDVDGDFRG